jgi:RNA polymerase sigma factor (sigma-70 family)
MTIQNQDQKDFAVQLIKHERIAHKFCNFYFKDREERLDVLQMIREAAWRSFQSFRNESKFTTWFYAIARNVTISTVRKKERAPIVFRFSGIGDMVDEDTDTVDRIKKEAVELDRLIDTLPERDRDMVYLYILGESQERIANLMDMDIRTVRVRMHRVKKSMRQKSRINII